MASIPQRIEGVSTRPAAPPRPSQQLSLRATAIHGEAHNNSGSGTVKSGASTIAIIIATTACAWFWKGEQGAGGYVAAGE